jgi:hypothetical protein
MGYHTEFSGEFKTDKPVDAETYLKMRGLLHTEHDEDKFPSYYCQWEMQDDKQTIQWDEEEKFYEYIKWIEFIICKILKPAGYKLSGRVTWQGEEIGDVGVIVIKDNSLDTQKAKFTI